MGGGLSLILEILGHHLFCLVAFSSPSSDSNYMSISPFTIILLILFFFSHFYLFVFILSNFY